MNGTGYIPPLTIRLIPLIFGMVGLAILGYSIFKSSQKSNKTQGEKNG